MAEDRQVGGKIALATRGLVEDAGDDAYGAHDQVTDIENLADVPCERERRQHQHEDKPMIEDGVHRGDRFRIGARLRERLPNSALLAHIDAEIGDIDEEQHQEARQLARQAAPAGAFKPIVKRPEAAHIPSRHNVVRCRPMIRNGRLSSSFLPDCNNDRLFRKLRRNNQDTI